MGSIIILSVCVSVWELTVELYKDIHEGLLHSRTLCLEGGGEVAILHTERFIQQHDSLRLHKQTNKQTDTTQSQHE